MTLACCVWQVEAVGSCTREKRGERTRAEERIDCFASRKGWQSGIVSTAGYRKSIWQFYARRNASTALRLISKSCIKTHDPSDPGSNADTTTAACGVCKSRAYN